MEIMTVLLVVRLMVYGRMGRNTYREKEVQSGNWIA